MPTPPYSCKVCKFMRAHPDEGEQIKASLEKHGQKLYHDRSNRISANQIASYLRSKYEDAAHINRYNAYDHYRVDHLRYEDMKPENNLKELNTNATT